MECRCCGIKFTCQRYLEEHWIEDPPQHRESFIMGSGKQLLKEFDKQKNMFIKKLRTKHQQENAAFKQELIEHISKK